MPQLLSLCSSSQEPQLLKLECPRACAPQQEQPHLPQACAQQWRLSTAKNKNRNLKLTRTLWGLPRKESSLKSYASAPFWSIELAKKFLWAFPKKFWETLSELFWPTQYLDNRIWHLFPEFSDAKIVASRVAQLVKNLPAMQETQVRFLHMGRSPGKGIVYPLQYSWASLMAQMVKNPSAMRETWVQSLGWEDHQKTTTEWQKWATWWQKARSPQTFWHLKTIHRQPMKELFTSK